MKICLSGIYYPMAILHYFRLALQRMDVELYTVGAYSGTWIAWNGGMHLPQKYNFIPTIPLGMETVSNVHVYSNTMCSILPKMDVWIQCDACFHFADRPNADKVVGICTDPHALGKDWYDQLRKNCDVTFNMQTPYMSEGDVYLPYAYDSFYHKPLEIEKEYDVTMAGVQYANREHLANMLRKEGFTVFNEVGHVFDEYREVNCKAEVGVNWSSQLDLTARVWELMAMGIPVVCNYVPDLETNGFVDGVHYEGFSSAIEAVAKVQEMYDTGSYQEISKAAYEKVVLNEENTWEDRVKFILKTLGM